MADHDHSAFTDDEFIGRDATFIPEVLAAGLVSETAVDGFLTDPATGGIYAPEGTSSIRVAFSLGVETIDLGGDIKPQGCVAKAGAASSEVLGIRNKDSVRVDGVTYRVLRVQPDETGWTTFFLGKRY